MAKLFASLKILIAYFYSRTSKTLLFTVKISRFLVHRTEISEILADVCLNSVAIVTLFDPLKILIIYVNSLTLFDPLTRKVSQYLIQK